WRIDVGVRFRVEVALLNENAVVVTKLTKTDKSRWDPLKGDQARQDQALIIGPFSALSELRSPKRRCAAIPTARINPAKHWPTRQSHGSPASRPIELARRCIFSLNSFDS